MKEQAHTLYGPWTFCGWWVVGFSKVSLECSVVLSVEVQRQAGPFHLMAFRKPEYQDRGTAED